MTNEVRDNAAKSRYELDVDGHIAFVEYRLAPGKITLLHTEVPRELACRGIGSVLAKDTLFVGPCRYDVVKVERSESRGERPTRVINVDYYAPELKLVIAKEYKENDGRLNLIKFDRIYPIRR